jgi:high-affinity Fe2+/Pb2+ permease
MHEPLNGGQMLRVSGVGLLMIVAILFLRWLA